MAKELPYFRFYPSEWLEGDITLENEKTQGFFMLLCAWYWKKDCLIDLEFIPEDIEELILNEFGVSEPPSGKVFDYLRKHRLNELMDNIGDFTQYNMVRT